MSLSLCIIISLILESWVYFFQKKPITPPFFKLNSRSLETCEAGTDPGSGMRGGVGGPL